jgi:hypothetical protein
LQTQASTVGIFLNMVILFHELGQIVFEDTPGLSTWTPGRPFPPFYLADSYTPLH